MNKMNEATIEVCPACIGAGIIDDEVRSQCPICGGTGGQKDERRDFGKSKRGNEWPQSDRAREEEPAGKIV